MKEFKWVEKITEKVWVALIAWVALATIANVYKYMLGDRAGEIIPATLQLVGLFLFLKALWKWIKSKRNKSS
jgi:L-lactate permease